MSLALASIILIGGLIFLLVIGTEIYVAMGVIAAIGLLFVVGQSVSQFAFTAFDVMNSFTITALPLFVFMGAMFSSTGIIKKLFTGADKLIGSLPGGVASSLIGACAIFGAISGSSLAAVATFGKIAFPEMERLGYNPRFSLGTIAIGGTLSVLIPPSVILIVYGEWQTLSVARLFAAGLIPGFILAVLLMLTVMTLVLISPRLAPKPPKIPFKKKLGALLDLLPFLGVMITVLGVIFAGIMTPTEAASLGGILSIVLALAYRSMSFSALKQSMWEAVKITAMIALIIFTARVLAQVFNYVGITDIFSSFMQNLPLGRYGIFVTICVMYLILGMFLDSLSMMVLTLPFIGPLIFDLGFNPIWFGVVFVVLAEIGLVTPPFGLNLFVLNAVVPRYDIMTIAMGALPFLIPALLTIVILVIFPDLALWLPSIMFN